MHFFIIYRKTDGKIIEVSENRSLERSFPATKRDHLDWAFVTKAPKDAAGEHPYRILTQYRVKNVIKDHMVEIERGA